MPQEVVSEPELERLPDMTADYALLGGLLASGTWKQGELRSKLPQRKRGLAG